MLTEHHLKSNYPYVLREEDHKYINQVTGEVVPYKTTTEVIQYIYPFNEQEVLATPNGQQRLDNGKLKGKCVHLKCELHVLGKDNEFVCNHNMKSHIVEGEAGINFVDALLRKFNPKEGWEVQPEKIMVSDTYKIAGSSDFVAYNFAKQALAIIDYKTTSKEHPAKEAMQTYTYAKIFEDTEKLPIKTVILGIVNTHSRHMYYFNKKDFIKAGKDFANALDKYNADQEVKNNEQER